MDDGAAGGLVRLIDARAGFRVRIGQQHAVHVQNIAGRHVFFLLAHIGVRAGGKPAVAVGKQAVRAVSRQKDE